MTKLTDRVNLSEVNVELTLPFLGKVSGKWQPDENERDAAWEMYVELVTRISVAELGPEEGLLREALSSLYALFNITRGILRAHGPVVAQPKGQGKFSFGYLAVAVLNAVLRPLLAHWHPLLLDYESHKPADASAVEWEKRWDKNGELRRALASARGSLIAFADLLAAVASVPSLIIPAPPGANTPRG